MKIYKAFVDLKPAQREAAVVKVLCSGALKATGDSIGTFCSHLSCKILTAGPFDWIIINTMVTAKPEAHGRLCDMFSFPTGYFFFS